MENDREVAIIKDDRKFEVECEAGDAGGLRAGTESLSVKVGQRVRRDGFEEMWQSVCVYAKEDENGNLVIRVLVFHPDWGEPLQIATIKSRPSDGDCQTTLGCNLDHVST